jgi:hypothetical protein
MKFYSTYIFVYVSVYWHATLNFFERCWTLKKNHQKNLRKPQVKFFHSNFKFVTKKFGYLEFATKKNIFFRCNSLFSHMRSWEKRERRQSTNRCCCRNIEFSNWVFSEKKGLNWKKQIAKLFFFRYESYKRIINRKFRVPRKQGAHFLGMGSNPRFLVFSSSAWNFRSIEYYHV